MKAVSNREFLAALLPVSPEPSLGRRTPLESLTNSFQKAVHVFQLRLKSPEADVTAVRRQRTSNSTCASSREYISSLLSLLFNCSFIHYSNNDEKALLCLASC